MRPAAASVLSSRYTWLRVTFQKLPMDAATPELEVVAGALPRDVLGTLLRSGPARHDVYGERFHHWFDGDGMVHALTFAGGRVTYKNRFVATLAKAEEDRAHRRLYGGFGT